MDRNKEVHEKLEMKTARHKHQVMLMRLQEKLLRMEKRMEKLRNQERPNKAARAQAGGVVQAL